MKIAIDCRMCGKSGIGAFIDGILPYFIQSKNPLTLIGITPETVPSTVKNLNLNDYDLEFIPCNIGTFSIRELLFFPKEITRKINRCDYFLSPYCNIPSGIRIPVYTTIHDIVFLDIPGLSSKIGTFVRKCFYQYAIIKSKGIFTVSEFSKNRIKAKLWCKKPVYVVHSALPEYLLSKENLSSDKTDSIIFIGNIKKHKGFSTLLPAFTEFNNQLNAQNKPKAKLVIVGSQDNFRTQDNTINNLLNSCNTEDIEFTGYISDEELQKKLSQARILVQPSTYEGFGLPPLQALHCGTNAILSDIPVFQEVYKDFPVTFFKTNDIQDLTNKMAQVWNKPEPINKIPEVYGFDKTTASIISNLN